MQLLVQGDLGLRKDDAGVVARTVLRHQKPQMAC